MAECGLVQRDAAFHPGAAARGTVSQFADVVRRGLDDVRVYSNDLTDRPALDMTAYVRRHRSELS